MPRKKPKSAPARRPPRARPINARGLKFGPQTRTAILAALRNGATQKLAAELAGVDARTLKTWLAKGRECLSLIAEWEQGGEQGPEPDLDVYGRFALEVAQARALADVELVGHITDAAKAGEWRAALALLGRRRPAEFGEHLSTSLVSLGGDEAGEERRDVTDELLTKLTLAARRIRGERAEGEDAGG